jgi:Uma2 family endonuclease
MNAVLEDVKPYRFTVEEYFRMGEIGVFAPEARVELIEGEIIEMPPIKPPHSGTVITLNRLLVPRCADKALVSVQNPMIISNFSAPQPDFAVLRPRHDDYQGKLPEVNDVILAIEVANTTLRYDLGRKSPLYARHGIRELWVIDVNEQVVHVCRDPSETGYRSTATLRGQDRVSIEAIPTVSIGLNEIFRV